MDWDFLGRCSCLVSLPLFIIYLETFCLNNTLLNPLMPEDEDVPLEQVDLIVQGQSERNINWGD